MKGLAAAFVVALATLLGSGLVRPAAASALGDSAATPFDSTSVTPTLTAPPDTLPPRRLLSSDGAIKVYQERRPGEGKNGFWWEYDAMSDLGRLLDKNRRSRPLDKLTDAYGFEVVAPESIIALRDSVSAVADSILAAQIQLSATFDPKLSSRYSEQKDTFDLTNELTSPVPISRRAAVETTLRNTNSFNRSTRKVQDGHDLSSSFNYHARDWLTSSFSVNRTSAQQRRDEVVESKSDGSSINGRLVATKTSKFGSLTADAGLAGNHNTYATSLTEGDSKQFSPSWHTNVVHPMGTGKIAADYIGHTDLGTRSEARFDPVLDQNGLPERDDLGNPITTRHDTTASERNLGNKLDLSADGKLDTIWSFRLNSSLGRERLQYIAQAESVAGRQETRENTNTSYGAHLEGKPVTGLEMLFDADRNLVEYQYAVVTESFNQTTSNEGKAEIRYDTWKGAKLIVKMDRNRENRNYLTSQRGFVDRESADVNWDEAVTPQIQLTGDYNINLDSYVYSDKVANTGDRDLRAQRGVVTVRYTPASAFTSSVHFDLRKDETVNVDAQLARDNKTDFTYVVTPDYTLTFGPTSLSGEFSADARYSVFDFDETKNFLTRRFSTRQRLQRSLTEHVSMEMVGTYEIQDEGSYEHEVAGGQRFFARSREVRRNMIESQVLYSPEKWIHGSVKYHREGENDYTITQGDRTPFGTFVTHELTFGLNVNRKFLRSIRLNLDASHGQKLGDRVTDVDRHYYAILASLEYQPFSKDTSDQGTTQ